VNSVRHIRLKIDDLFGIDPQERNHPRDLVAVSAYVLRHYAFLPKPITVVLEGDEVVISFPEEVDAKKEEASHLVERAVKRANEGNYQRAIGIYKRVLELQPSFHAARRDLAMAYVEVGDVENATNHLIEVLRLDPKDAWSWVVLANLYIREKADPDTGEKFLRKALELQPNDAWALNSLAAVYQKKGQTDEAVKYFEQAIQANPDFGNPYYGRAIALAESNEPEKAVDSLTQLFARAKMQDARSQAVYDGARELFAKLQVDLARRKHSEAFKCIQDYKAEMEALSGFPIRFEETDFEDQLGATIQMAWKHGRDYHLIKTRRGYDPELLAHLEAHELTHLKLESEARKSGKNLFFATTAKSREFAIRSVGGDIRKMEKEGFLRSRLQRLRCRWSLA